MPTEIRLVFRLPSDLGGGSLSSLDPAYAGLLGAPSIEQFIMGEITVDGDLVYPLDEDLIGFDLEDASVHFNTVAEILGTRKDDVLTGGEDDDYMDAGTGADVMVGNGGWDVMIGGGGGDVMVGNAGDDLMYGGKSRDIMQGNQDNDDLFGGNGLDNIYGGDGDDFLSGDAGRDLLFGGNGDDVLSGGTQNDRLKGGKGDDIFVFAAGTGRDKVKDFDKFGADKIALSFAGIETFEDAQGIIMERGGRTVLEVGEDRLILEGVALDGLTIDDFVFV